MSDPAAPWFCGRARLPTTLTPPVVALSALAVLSQLLVGFHHNAIKWLPCRTLTSFLQCQETRSPLCQEDWCPPHVGIPTHRPGPGRVTPPSLACLCHPLSANPFTSFHFSLGEKAFQHSETISNNFLSIHPAHFIVCTQK